MKTYIPDKADIEQKWYLVNLDGATLGRAAVKVAGLLRGKNKPNFTPHIDTGDFVVAVNAAKLKVTGSKAENMKYFRYSGYPGGLKERTFEQLIKSDPPRIFIHAVKGMLPKNKLGRKMIKKLHVYADENHKQNAQKPEPLKLSD